MARMAYTVFQGVWTPNKEATKEQEIEIQVLMDMWNTEHDVETFLNDLSTLGDRDNPLALQLVCEIAEIKRNGSTVIQGTVSDVAKDTLKREGIE